MAGGGVGLSSTSSSTTVTGGTMTTPRQIQRKAKYAWGIPILALVILVGIGSVLGLGGSSGHVVVEPPVVLSSHLHRTATAKPPLTSSAFSTRPAAADATPYSAAVLAIKPTAAGRKETPPSSSPEDGVSTGSVEQEQGVPVVVVTKVSPLYPISPLATVRNFEGIQDMEFKQLHHGIYRVMSTKTNTKYAFKTECRPAAKWHGQQGWTEVAAHYFSLLLFPNRRGGPMVPFAKGLFVVATQQQVNNVVHRDRCGVIPVEQLKRFLTGTDLSTLGEELKRYAPPSLLAATGGGAAATEGTAERMVAMYGVGLEWQEVHDDGAFPSRDVLRWFSGEGTSPASRGPRLTKAQAKEVMQISDILILDYLLGNNDREEKNWFHDQHKERVAMDNGWVFAGPDYVGSVCDTFETYLRCPPLFRTLSKSKNCRKGALQNCRFRKETVAIVRQLAGRAGNQTTSRSTGNGTRSTGGWDGRHRFEWMEQLATDPLLQFLFFSYDGQVEKKGKGREYSVPLARYIQGCAKADKNRPQPLRRRHHHLLLPVTAALSEQNRLLLDFLADGISKRLAELVKHIDRCIEKHGEESVLLSEGM